MDRPNLTNVPHIEFSSKSHSRNPSRSPTRSASRHRITEDILSDLSPASTLEAFTSDAPSGKLRASVEAATPSERAFGIRATLASKKIQEWVDELSAWPWPKGAGAAGFEIPSAKRIKLNSDSIQYGASDESERASYMGSLPALDVYAYEGRIDEIQDDMEDLDVEGIKKYVLNTHFSPRSRPSSSASEVAPMPTSLLSYTKMDDFAAIVTATVLKSLPYLSRLMRLLDVWSIRLSVLRNIPPLLGMLDDAESALKSGWQAIQVQNRTEDGEVGYLDRQTFETMKGVLQDIVTTLGQDLDYMLDSLEGKEDTLPDSWLDRMEGIETNYGEWVVSGDRKVREGEWARMAQRRKEEERLKAELAAREIARQEAERLSQEQEETMRKAAEESGKKALIEAARLEAEMVRKREDRLRDEEAARLEAARIKKEEEDRMKAVEAAKQAEEEILRQQAATEAIRFEAEQASIKKEEALRLEQEKLAELPQQEEEQLQRTPEDIQKDDQESRGTYKQQQPLSTFEIAEGPLDRYVCTDSDHEQPHHSRPHSPASISLLAAGVATAVGMKTNAFQSDEMSKRTSHSPPRFATYDGNDDSTVENTDILEEGNDHAADEEYIDIQTAEDSLTLPHSSPIDKDDHHPSHDIPLENTLASPNTSNAASDSELILESSNRSLESPPEEGHSLSTHPDNEQALSILHDSLVSPTDRDMDVEGGSQKNPVSNLVDGKISDPDKVKTVNEQQAPISSAPEKQNHLNPQNVSGRKKGHGRNLSTVSAISSFSAVSGYSISDPSPEIYEAESAEYFRPVLSPIRSPGSFEGPNDFSTCSTPTAPNVTTSEIVSPIISQPPILPDEILSSTDHVEKAFLAGNDDLVLNNDGAIESKLQVVELLALEDLDADGLAQRTSPIQHIVVPRRESNSSLDSTLITQYIGDATFSPVPSSPTSIAEASEPFPDIEEQSPLAGRVGRRNLPYDYSPPDSPPPIPAMSNRRSLSLLNSPSPTPSSPLETPITPTFEDIPNFPSLAISPAPFSSPKKVKTTDDQLQAQISSLLENIQDLPARINLTSEPDLDRNPLSPSSSSLNDALRIKKPRKSLTPSVRSTSSMSMRAPTPSFTLAPAYGKSAPRPRHQNGNPEIKLYHLSRNTGEAPIKLFVRLVGENGERVMVRVGGGWADLGEYLREYASHHGRRVVSGQTANDKVEIQDLPSRVVSSSSTVMPHNGRSSPVSRPNSVLERERPMSSLYIRKTRKSVGEQPESNTGMVSFSPSTPMPSSPSRRSYDTPPSLPIRSVSRMDWTEEEGGLGLAGPKGKPKPISEKDQEWVESMKEKVRLASAEKEKEKQRKDGVGKGFGELEKVGGTKRLFKKKA